MAEPTDVPELFARAVASLRAAQPRAEVRLQEIASPQRIAPHSFALSGEVTLDGEDVATGRLVLLYDPKEQASWAGTLRIVAYVSADVDREMALDPLLADVGWSWLIDALTSHGARYAAAGGTVTRTTSTRFGELADSPDTADVELRASWTPLDADLSAHLAAWCELLCSTAGLPPPGITQLPRSRTG